MSEDVTALDDQLAEVQPPDEMDEQEDTSELDELQEKLEDIESRITELEMEERRDQQLQAIDAAGDTDIFEKVFPATVATDGTFTELVAINGAMTTFPDGRTGSVITLSSGQQLVVEVVDPGTTPPSVKFIAISGGGGAEEFKRVILKHNGDDGDGNPLYDVYNPTDSTYTTALTVSPVPPENGRWRGASGLEIAAAPDGSNGIAYLNSGGNVVGLLTDAETVCTSDGLGLVMLDYGLGLGF